MGNLCLITLVLLLGGLESYAFSRQRRHYTNNFVDDLDCDKVSFSERSKVPNHHIGHTIGQECYNIDSSNTTILSLHPSSFGCGYKVETFSTDGCVGRKVGQHSFTSEFRSLKLNDWENRVPVCSLEVHVAPVPGDYLGIKFLEPYHNDKSRNVTHTHCWNLCEWRSSYHPYTLELKIHSGNYVQSYDEYVTLFSSPGCGDNDEDDENSRIGSVRSGDNLVALTSRPSEVRSYSIVSSNPPVIFFKK